MAEWQAVRWSQALADRLAPVIDDDCRALAEAGAAVPAVLLRDGEPAALTLLHYDGSTLTVLGAVAVGQEGAGPVLPDIIADITATARQIGAARVGFTTRRPGLVRELLRSDPAWRAEVIRELT